MKQTKLGRKFLLAPNRFADVAIVNNPYNAQREIGIFCNTTLCEFDKSNRKKTDTYVAQRTNIFSKCTKWDNDFKKKVKAVVLSCKRKYLLAICNYNSDRMQIATLRKCYD